MARLSRTASGTRHLRWAGEAQATLHAHIEVNDKLTDPQKKALSDEIAIIKTLVADLDGAVAPYRAFIDGAHVAIRAKQRVANFLCDEAQRQTDGAMRPYKNEVNAAMPGGFARIFSRLPLSRVLKAGHETTARLAREAAGVLQSLPPAIPGTAALAERLEKVGGLLDTFVNERAEQIEPQRRPLKLAVEKRVLALREGLEQMDGRLRSHFSQSFIDSLYPELTRRGTALADEDDEEDDATALPEDAAAAPAGGGEK